MLITLFSIYIASKYINLISSAASKSLANYISHTLAYHIFNQASYLDLSNLEAFFEQSHIIFLVLRSHLLVAKLLYPPFPPLHSSPLAQMLFLVLFGIALTHSFPLVELPVYGEVGLLEVLFLVAFERSRWIHQIVGCIELW